MLYLRNYKIGVTFMSDSNAVVEDRMILRAWFPALVKGHTDQNSDRHGPNCSAAIPVSDVIIAMTSNFSRRQPSWGAFCIIICENDLISTPGTKCDNQRLCRVLSTQLA
jgi:hypothetical protein